jgi:DNA-binding transcriptional LysR family regulator
MPSLTDYATFAAIIEAGSLTAAAQRTERSLQSVSRSLSEIEKDVGVSLIRRTTRQMQTTRAGLKFYARIKTALADLEAAHIEATEEAEEIAGLLKVGSSTLFGPAHVAPALATFLQRHPNVIADLVLADDFSDLLAEGIDAAVRIGALANSGLRARRVAELRRVAFAAPSYLETHGRPERLQDLKNHACVVRTQDQSPDRWEFREATRPLHVPVSARFRSDSAAACNMAVASGLGIGLAPQWQIKDLLAGGDVELLLEDFEPEPVPVHIVWPQAHALPVRVRLFIDFLAARLATSLS